VQGRDVLLEDDLDQLDERRNDEDKDRRLHVGEVDAPVQQLVVDGPGDRRRHDLDEDDRDAHAGRLVELLGHAQKRADAQEFDEHVVVRDGRGENDEDHGFHCAVSSFPQTPLLQSMQPMQPNSFFLMALPLEILFTSAMRQPNTKKPPGAMVRMPMGFSWNQGMGMPHQLPPPRISRMVAIEQMASVKPRPMPSPSIAESMTPCLLAYISARPRMMQLTTMRARYTPSDWYRL